jgi:nucleotide-binding universal stress UspA family protein
MQIKSILVALDGSKDALNASVVAWQLAKKVEARIAALSVIDTQSIWGLLGQKLSGLIGSGPYVSGYESIYSSLRSITDALLMTFETRSLGHGLKCDVLVGEGNTAEIILENAEKYDLLVMGRRPKYLSVSSHSFIKPSLSQKLACQSQVPVLIVSSEPRSWQRARLILDSQSFDTKKVEDFIALARDLNLESELFCCDDASLVEPQLKKHFAQPIHLLSHDPEYGDDSWRAAIDVNSATVLMMLTSENNGTRVLAGGPTISKLIEALPAVSFCVFPPAVKVDSQKTGTAKTRVQVQAR